MDVALAARNVEKLEDLSIQTKASLHKCDASKIEDVKLLFKYLDEKLGIPELVVYNPSARLRGSIETLDPEKTKEYFGSEGMLGYVANVQRKEIREGIACVKHQNMSGSDMGDDHKEYFAGEAALKAAGKDNTMNQF